MSKPICKLTGTDGNVFAIIATVKKVLVKARMPEKAIEFEHKAMASESYNDVLQLTFEYVEVE